MRPPVAPGADRARPMPSTPSARLDDIRAALAGLRRERARFERLGFELPQARCHGELRYWGFLEALHSLPPAGGPPSLRDGSAWPAPPAR